jgi:uncharacterized coiled-coil protein SlyX
MNEDKIIAIETTLSHQERQIQDLSATIALQWKEIERLKRLLERALERMEADAGAPPANVKPPHH